MLELLKIAKGTARNWRDTRTWDRLPPHIRAVAPALRYQIPNTKYGNALVPWFLRQLKAGNILSDWPNGHKELVRALTKVREWEGKGNPKKVEEWKDKAEQADHNLHGRQSTSGWPDYRKRPNPEYGGESGYRMKGWSGYDEDYGDIRPHVSLAQAAREITAMQKEQKRRGLEPINPLQFQNPADLKRMIDKAHLEKGQKSGAVLHTLPNGWTVRQLMNQKDADWESHWMDNCVKDYGDELPKSKGLYGSPKTILSLRDPNNKPHVTWGVSDENQMQNVYGKGNVVPKKEYQALIRAYHETLSERPDAAGRGPIVTEHTGLGGPSIDEYGAVTRLTPQWPHLVNSTWRQDPTGTTKPGFYPENVQKVVNAVENGFQKRQLAVAVRDHVEELSDFLRQRKQEGPAGQPAFDATLMTPWAQTLKAYQEALGESPDGREEGNILQHYSVEETREHIGTSGKLCTCGWGGRRPSWDPEWDYHTDWLDED